MKICNAQKRYQDSGQNCELSVSTIFSPPATQPSFASLDVYPDRELSITTNWSIERPGFQNS